MSHEVVCTRCEKRNGCGNICESMERILKKEERHFQGREILVSPSTITAIFSGVHARTLADYLRDDSKPTNVERFPGLTDRQWKIYKMILTEGKSHRAIARMLGLSQSTVGEQALTARRKARRWYEERLRAHRRGRLPQDESESSGRKAG